MKVRTAIVSILLVMLFSVCGSYEKVNAESNNGVTIRFVTVTTDANGVKKFKDKINQVYVPYKKGLNGVTWSFDYDNISGMKFIGGYYRENGTGIFPIISENNGETKQIVPEVVGDLGLGVRVYDTDKATDSSMSYKIYNTGVGASPAKKVKEFVKDLLKNSNIVTSEIRNQIQKGNSVTIDVPLAVQKGTFDISNAFNLNLILSWNKKTDLDYNDGSHIVVNSKTVKSFEEAMLKRGYFFSVKSCNRGYYTGSDYTYSNRIDSIFRPGIKLSPADSSLENAMKEVSTAMNKEKGRLSSDMLSVIKSYQTGNLDTMNMLVDKNRDFVQKVLKTFFQDLSAPKIYEPVVRQEMQVEGTVDYATFVVTCVSGDGTVLDRIEYNINTQKMLPEVHPKLGAISKGWQLPNGNTVNYLDGKYFLEKKIGSCKLTVNWEYIKYKLYYNYNDGELVEEGANVPSEYTVLGGERLPKLKKQYYTFDGWYLDKNFTELATPKEGSTKLKEGIVGIRRLYAKFSPIVHNVNYELNEGTLEEGYPETHRLDQKLWLPEPTKEGYRFEGWYLTEDFSGKAIKGIEKDVNEDVTVYAKWKSLDEIKAEEDAKQAEKDAKQAEEDKKVHDAKPDYLIPTKEEDNKVEEVKASDVKTEEYKAPAEEEKVDYNELTSELESYKVKFVKVRNKKGKKLKISWGKSSIKDCKYEIEVSTSKKFKKVSKKWKSAELTKLVSSKSLKTGGKYYVRVRAFKTINNKVVYGKWSVAKVIRIKNK